MNALADEMTPYLHASGITVTRNDPDGSAAQSIRDSNASRQDFHLAAALGTPRRRRCQAVCAAWTFTIIRRAMPGLRMANILVE